MRSAPNCGKKKLHTKYMHYMSWGFRAAYRIQDMLEPAVSQVAIPMEADGKRFDLVCTCGLFGRFFDKRDELLSGMNPTFRIHFLEIGTYGVFAQNKFFRNEGAASSDHGQIEDVSFSGSELGPLGDKLSLFLEGSRCGAFVRSDGTKRIDECVDSPISHKPNCCADKNEA